MHQLLYISAVLQQIDSDSQKKMTTVMPESVRFVWRAAAGRRSNVARIHLHPASVNSRRPLAHSLPLIPVINQSINRLINKPVAKVGSTGSTVRQKHKEMQKNTGNQQTSASVAIFALGMNKTAFAAGTLSLCSGPH